MDFVEILTSSLKISCKEKKLWLFGVVNSLPVALVILVYGLVFALVFRGSIPGSSSGFEDFIESGAGIAVWLGIMGLFLLMFVTMFFLSTIGVIGPTLGAARAERGETISFRGLFTASLPFFWRALGLVSLVWLGMMAVMLVLEFIVMFLTIITLGLASFLMFPLILLFYPAMVIVFAYMELSLAAIVLKDMRLFDAMRHGWTLLKQNFWKVAFLSLMLYLVVSIISTVVIMVFMMPMLVLPVLPLILANSGTMMSDSQVVTAALVISGLCMLVFIPVLAVLMGWLMAFWQSAWALAYERLTRAAGLAIEQTHA
jgi:hypothetical protein